MKTEWIDFKNTETYTLNLTEKKFELLDMILFEEWRDYVDVGPNDENYNCKYANEDPDLPSADDFNSLYDVLDVERQRKKLKNQWDN